MLRQNKKGVEAIVGTVLILLIVIAIAGILWGVVIPMTREGGQKVTLQQACMTTNINIVQKLGTDVITYYDPTSKILKVVVGRGAGVLDIRDIQIISYDASGNSKTVLVGKANIPGENEQKSYDITEAQLGAGFVPSKVSLAVQLGLGETVNFCDPTAKLTVESVI